MVSNNKNNENSNVVEVVYMTTQSKNRPPDTCDSEVNRQNQHGIV